MRLRRNAALAMCAALLGVAGMLSGCGALRAAADIHHRRFKVGDVAEVTFGGASVRLFPAGGSVEHVSVRPCPGATLTESTLRVFDDTNGDGVWSEGEPVHQFDSTQAGDGFEYTSIELSSGQVRGWRRGSWQVNVTDDTGAEHIHAETF